MTNLYNDYTNAELMSAYSSITNLIILQRDFNDFFLQALNEQSLDIEEVAYARNNLDLIEFISNTGDGVVR